MLFIPDGSDAGPFWIKGMLFPLDLIWIGSDCRVVAITVDAQVPDPRRRTTGYGGTVPTRALRTLLKSMLERPIGSASGSATR